MCFISLHRTKSETVLQKVHNVQHSKVHSFTMIRWLHKVTSQSLTGFYSSYKELLVQLRIFSNNLYYDLYAITQLYTSNWSKCNVTLCCSKRRINGLTIADMTRSRLRPFPVQRRKKASGEWWILISEFISERRHGMLILVRWKLVLCFPRIGNITVM